MSNTLKLAAIACIILIMGSIEAEAQRGCTITTHAGVTDIRCPHQPVVRCETHGGITSCR